MVRLPSAAKCSVALQNVHTNCGAPRPPCNGHRYLSRRYNALPLTSIHSGPIPPYPPIYPNGTQRRNCAFLGASAHRAHKVAIRPVTRLPDVARPDERLTVMLQDGLWQTGDRGNTNRREFAHFRYANTGLASRLLCNSFLAMQASVRAPQPLNALSPVVTICTASLT